MIIVDKIGKEVMDKLSDSILKAYGIQAMVLVEFVNKQLILKEENELKEFVSNGLIVAE